MTPRARIGVAQVWQEVNTYSRRPTTLQSFEALALLTGDDVARRHHGARTVLGAFIADGGFDAVPLLDASAWPAAPADASTAESLLERLDDALARNGPLDGLLLALHGAMVCEGHEDMEADILALVRRRLPDVPVACVLDLHGNPSRRFVEQTCVAIAYDTYPHVDMWERGAEAAALLTRALEGRPLSTSLRRLPLLTSPPAQDTSAAPMNALLASARRRAGVGKPHVRLSLLPGFAYSDVARAGFSVLGVTGASTPEAAASLQEMLDEVDACASAFAVSALSPADAVAHAIAAGPGPSVLADVADNVGGGGPGDGTVLLAELLTQRVANAVAILADAETARQAHDAGEGARIDVRLGGRLDPTMGEPIPAMARVLALSDGVYRTQGSWNTGQSFSMGPSALLEVEGVRVLLTSQAVPPFHAEQLTSLGVALEQTDVIVAKGAVAWQAAYGDVAARSFVVDTPGPCPIDPSSLPRRNPPVPE